MRPRPELASRGFLGWARAWSVALGFIRPGKPVDNACIESFNGKLRDECLNEQFFTDLAEARRTIEHWRRHCNRATPQRARPGDANRVRCAPHPRPRTTRTQTEVRLRRPRAHRFITVGVRVGTRRGASTFWPEAAAVMAFAAAWLVKGQTVLKDRPA